MIRPVRADRRPAPWPALAAVLLAPFALAAEPAPLTPPVRERLDRQALALPPETIPEEAVDLAGDLASWLVSQVPLTPEEERDHAAARHREILETGKPLPVPEAAAAVWRRLLERLPPHLRPEVFRYTLTVLDLPETDSFTVGGGFVYLSRPLLERLLAEPRRGEAALGFVLARELGHIGLGHTRRGWQLFEAREAARRGVRLCARPEAVERLLGTGIHMAGRSLYFLYARDQHHEADLFAWQLCGSAGLDPDQALDALRLLALLEGPPPAAPGRGALAHYLTPRPPALPRLRRLLMERDGLVDEPERYGLFRERADGDLERCPDGAVGAGRAAVVLVHGLHGNADSLAELRHFLAGHEEMAGRTLLVFRHPGNESLARCGELLTREVRRVLAEPGAADFVCHSAGGLVFRYYAEVRHGGFRRAVFLGTPHGGSDLTELKFLVDAAEFASGLAWGLPAAVRHSVREGRGQIGQDLHPDSLFLRRLDAAGLAGRYQVVAGRAVGLKRGWALRLTLAAARHALRDQVRDRLPADLQRQALHVIDRLRLPEEVLDGDLIVSTDSACLPGAARTAILHLPHLALRDDPEVLRLVLTALTEAPR
jgi:hypothetical protein